MLSLKARAVSLALVALLTAGAGGGAELAPQVGYQLVADLMASDKGKSKAAARDLGAAGDASLVPALVDALFFTPRQQRGRIVAVLEELTGASIGGDYKGWVAWVGSHQEIEPKAGYVEWKGLLFSQIDERYRQIFGPGARLAIRPQEILWGGVPLDGIPSLDDPPLTDAGGARYLDEDELVFGVVIGGTARAYPRRFMSWHEMLNDEVGGEPITLSYCTLCGSAIAYSRRAGAEVRRFGTSGLLYRSNKLMFDRETLTLWSNLTGEPVVGDRVGESALAQIPLTLTTWGDWRARHPDTETLDLQGIKRMFRGRYAFDYLPGAADRARHGVSFPVWQASDALDRNAEVFALRLGGAAKAYPLERVLAAGVINDEVGGVPLVLVADAESGSVRAYARAGASFSGSADQLTDDRGRQWTVSEGALHAAEEGLEPLPRLAGHVAFWFGWYGFYPETEVYGRD